MKNNLLAMLLAAGLLFTAGSAAGADSAAADSKGVGTLVVKIGMVEVQRAGSAQWIKAQKGMLIYAGDRIKTRELARAALIFEDGSLTRMNENTDLELKPKTGDSQNRLKILLGQLWARIHKQENTLEIETPSAVAAIKGTELELHVFANGQSDLIVWDGLVRFFNQQGEVLVQASQQSSALRDQAPGAPVQVKLEGLEQWFEHVVETPQARSLKAVVKDQQGQEQTIRLQYKKQ